MRYDWIDRLIRHSEKIVGLTGHDAITIWPFVFVNSHILLDRAHNPDYYVQFLRHEKTHWFQWLWLWLAGAIVIGIVAYLLLGNIYIIAPAAAGYFTFPAIYLLFSRIHGYRNNPFEIAARKAEEET